jgi:glycosyltransferase involved in cell wall biosynthesis
MRSAERSNSQPRKRVVHVVETMGLGGMERMIATLAMTTDAEQYHVSVLCLKEFGAEADRLSEAGIEVHLAHVPRHRPEYFPFRRVERCLRALSPDVVHTHNTPGLVYGAVGAWLAGVPTIVHTEHGRQFPGRLRYAVAERVASTFAWRVVGVSDAMSSGLRRHVKIDRSKLRTIPNGVIAPEAPLPAEIRAVMDSIGVPPDAKIVGLAARLVYEKGIEYLLDAWPSITKSIPSAVLLLVGDGPERNALEARAEQLGIQASVKFVGMRSDVATFMHAFDVCVMPSVSEGLPLALLEGMAARRAIVATRVGGMPQALDDGRAGLLVEPRDAPGLANAIVRLLSHPDEAGQLGSAARARFEMRYTAHSMAAAYQTMYRRADDDAWTPVL